MSVSLIWHKDIEEVPEKIVMEALWLVGQDTIKEAMNNIPLDTGTLRRSGTVTVGALPDAKAVYAFAPFMSTKTAYEGMVLGPLKVVYVSYNTPYARRLHEDMSWKPRAWKYGRRKGKTIRIPKPAVGGPKWIERALPRAWSRLPQMIARARRKFERGDTKGGGRGK
jgi:hypothetical protein